MYRMQLSSRRRRLILGAAAVTSCFVVAFALAHDPEPSTQPRHDMRPDYGPPPHGHHPDRPPPPHDQFGGNPDRDFPAERDARMGVGMGFAPRFDRWMPRPEEDISEEEWQEVVALMSEHSPTRLKLLKKVEDEHGEDSRAVQILKRRGVGLKRMLYATQKSSPTTYKFALDQIEIEDEIIAALDDLRAGESPEKRQKLNAATRKFVENNFAEREVWLNMLEESISRQREALKADRDKIDDIVKIRSERFESEYDKMAKRIDEDDDRPPPPDDR